MLNTVEVSTTLCDMANQPRRRQPKISLLPALTAAPQARKLNASLQRQVATQQAKLANLQLATQALATGPQLANGQTRNQRRRARQRQLRDNFYQGIGMAPPQMRDGTPNNPADPRSGKSMRQLGQTQFGAAWCLRALHPCGEGLNLVPKVPDGALSDSVVLERRDEYVINNPFAVGPQLADAPLAPTWNCAVISLPLLRTPTMCIAWKGELDRDAMRVVARTMIQYSGANTNNDHGAYPNWGELTEYPNMKFTIMQCAALDKGKDSKLGDVFLSLRRTYCGLTTDYDANTLTDKGRVVSGQFIGSLAETMGNVAVDVTVPGPSGQEDTKFKTITHTFDLVTYTGVPNDVDELTQMDLKVRQAEAKTGDYMPLRFWEPTFVNTSGADPTCADLNNLDKGTVGADYPEALKNWNYPLHGWGFGMSFWRSMDDTTSLRLKRREGLEMNTAATSDFSPFSTPAYPADLRAQTVFREFCRQQPHSFDSSYNSLGGMLGNIVKGLGGVLGGLGIPIISDIAPGLGGLLGGILESVPI